MSGEVTQGRTLKGPQTWDADVVIVGSGAGGAVVASELIQEGLNVLVLEEGPMVSPKEHGRMRPTQHMRAVWRQGAMSAAIGLGGSPLINITMGRCVGGSSALTGGVCFRTPGWVLKEWSEERGLSDLTEETMAPFFDEIEERLHIRPVPVEMRSRSTKLFGEGLEKLGHQLKPIHRNTRDCSGLGQCNFGCPQGSKMSVDRSVLPEAIASGLRVVSDCLVERIVVTGDRATGVRGRLYNRQKHKQPGDAFEVKARRVIVCAGGVHSSLLLMKSGIGKRSRQVGRNLTVHPGFRIIARFDEPVHGWRGALQSAFCDDFEEEGVTLVSVFVPPGAVATGIPGIGLPFAARAQELSHLAMFAGILHDDPRGRIRPFVGREPLITYRMSKKDKSRIPIIVRRLGEAYLAAGAKELYLPILGHEPVSADAFRSLDLTQVRPDRFECSSQHPLGTCRMGTSASDSVVDSYGETWDVRGLYVSDGSIIPSSLGVNPQETIMAMSLRIARKMVERRPL